MSPLLCRPFLFLAVASLSLARLATALGDGPSDPASTRSATSTTPRAWLQKAMTTLASDRERVERRLAADSGQAARPDLLVMYGRSAAASGQFAESAAACVMFLSECGFTHSHSEQVLSRLAASLAPLDLDSVNVLLTPEGPKYHPRWRMDKPAPEDHLRLAVGAYELLADMTKDRDQASKAIATVGWIYRALGDWDASTAAWDRVADRAKGSADAADALWKAADNLAWTGKPAEAAQRIRRLIAECPNDARRRVAEDRLEVLKAEAKRTPKWLEDPVGSLRKEISARAPRRRPHEVYASAASWLKTRGETSALIEVSRWARTQTDWPATARLACLLDLADALLQVPDATPQRKAEAADVLDEVMAIAPDDDSAISAGLRRCGLLRELGRHEESERTLTVVEDRARSSAAWLPEILRERILLLISSGNLPAARSVRDQLLKQYPDYELPPEVIKRLSR